MEFTRFLEPEITFSSDFSIMKYLHLKTCDNLCSEIDLVDNELQLLDHTKLFAKIVQRCAQTRHTCSMSAHNFGKYYICTSMIEFWKLQPKLVMG